MRPRVFPAEDRGDGRSRSPLPPGRFNEAAGIPRGRLYAAVALRHQYTRFNEAAGIPRGRHADVREGVEEDSASMRPRVFPAEDRTGVPSEAAQHHRLQ